jgi:hypothetical protein
LEVMGRLSIIQGRRNVTVFLVAARAVDVTIRARTIRMMAATMIAKIVITDDYNHEKEFSYFSLGELLIGICTKGCITDRIQSA